MIKPNNIMWGQGLCKLVTKDRESKDNKGKYRDREEKKDLSWNPSIESNNRVSHSDESRWENESLMYERSSFDSHI